MDKYLIATAFDGKELDDLGVNTVEAYEDKNDKILRKEIEGYPLFSPQTELHLPPVPHKVEVAAGEDLTERVTEVYKELCDSGDFVPGKFGDFLQVFQTGEDEYLMLVSRKAFPKAALAADAPIIFKGVDTDGDVAYMTVTGIRGADPGKGGPAWLGGFLNLGFVGGIEVLDSGAYTLLHEGLEEGNLRIECDDPEPLRTDYLADDISVIVSLGDGDDEEIYQGVMRLIGMIPTGDDEFEDGGEAYADGTKRVHVTLGYAVLLDLEDTLVDEDTLSGWLNPGDDIKELLFIDVTEYVQQGTPTPAGATSLYDTLDFGIQHHNEFVKPLIECAYEEWESD